jgi:hypothetical protein
VDADARQRDARKADSTGPGPAPRRRVVFRYFDSTWGSWHTLFQEAADFASQIGPERLISISHSEDDNDGVVAVWYWEDV